MKDEDGLPPNEQAEALPPPVSEGLPRGTRNVALLAALLLLPTTVACGLALGPKVAVGSLCGGALALGNFWLLGRMVVQLTSSDNELAIGPLMARLLSKLALLGICLYALVVWARVDVLGLLAGLSVVVVSTLVSQVFGFLR